MTIAEDDPVTLRQVKTLMLIMDEMQKGAPNCTVNTMKAFLSVAMYQGATVGEIQKAIGLPATSTSRAVSVLLKRARGKSGYDLVESRPNFKDARVKHLHLTPAGDRVWDQMQEHLRA